MIANILTIFAFWLLAIYLNFLTVGLWSYFNIDFLWLFSFALLIALRSKSCLIVLLIFGLTSDNWVLLYPGINAFSNLVLGYLYLRYYDTWQFDEFLGRITLFAILLLASKIINYLFIYVLGGYFLFDNLIKIKFWFNIIISVLIGIGLLHFIEYITRRFKILAWSTR